MPMIPEDRVDRFVSDRVLELMEKHSDRLLDKIFSKISKSLPFWLIWAKPALSVIKAWVDGQVPEALVEPIEEWLEEVTNG